jgi:hypothetical protein
MMKNPGIRIQGLRAGEASCGFAAPDEFLKRGEAAHALAPES